MPTNPITPPPELVEQWADMLASRSDHAVFTMAAQWGADQELEAVISLEGQSDLPEEDRYFDGFTVAGIRANRRPKPPSLKEQALEILEINNDVDSQLSAVHYNIIRRALEQL